MLSVRPLNPAVAIRADTPEPALSGGMERTVADLWAEQQAKSKNLFDGRVFSVSQLNENRISGGLIGYRRFVAQTLQPDLFDQLKVRSLAVSGFMTCPDGVVFGHRAETMLQDGGLWELAPSGGVDGQARTGDDRIDLQGQILQEMEEETGLTPNQVASVEPWCLVEDDQSHVIEAVLRITVTAGRQAILAAHGSTSGGEYSAMEVVPAAALAAFMENPMVDVSRLLIFKSGLLDC